MASVHADPALLDKVATELDRIADDIAVQRKGIKSAAEQTASAWRSQHTGVFLNRVEITDNTLNMNLCSVRKSAGELRAAAKEIRRIETEIQELNEGD